MSTTKLIGLIILAFGLHTAFAQNALRKADPAASAARVNAVILAAGGQGSGSGKPADKPGKPDKTPADKPVNPSRPDHPDKPGKSDSSSSDQLKRMQDDIKAAKEKYVEDQKELQQKLKTATEDQKDKIRAEIRDKRDAFIEQQKEMREEFRKRVNELKDQLKDHQDLIDDAKEQIKQSARQRKGGGN